MPKRRRPSGVTQHDEHAVPSARGASLDGGGEDDGGGPFADAAPPGGGGSTVTTFRLPRPEDDVVSGAAAPAPAVVSRKPFFQHVNRLSAADPEPPPAASEW